MAHSLHEFVRRKPFLLCVDSDGCAMDTMNIKHFRCFGPCFADEWGLGAGRDAALRRWNEINLFSMTRGINRFLGLAHILTELFPDDQNVAAFSRWAQTSKELSERAVEAHAAENSVFSKALSWSRAVNKAIGELTDDEKTAFRGVRAVLEECPAEMDFFEKFVENGLKAKLQNIVESKFAVLEYTDAIELLKKANASFQYPVEWGCDLQTEHEKYITEQVFKKPVFVINYPKEIKSFYMKQNADGKTVAATDLLVPGIGEIIGGSEREADPDKLLSAMQARKMDISSYEQYLDLRKFGTAPHGGFGLGFDRFVMYVTGMENIRDVVLFPRTVKNIM